MHPSPFSKPPIKPNETKNSGLSDECNYHTWFQWLLEEDALSNEKGY